MRRWHKHLTPLNGANDALLHGASHKDMSIPRKLSDRKTKGLLKTQEAESKWKGGFLPGKVWRFSPIVLVSWPAQETFSGPLSASLFAHPKSPAKAAAATKTTLSNFFYPACPVKTLSLNKQIIGHRKPFQFALSSPDTKLPNNTNPV